MNAFWLWLSWMFLAACFLIFVLTFLFRYLTRLRDPLPEGILQLSRPLDWASVNLALDLDDAKTEIKGSPSSVARRMVQFRLAVSWEYFRRMEHNAFVVQQCAKSDQQDLQRANIQQRHERQVILSEAQAMLQGADLCQHDSDLPEHESEAEQLRTEAADLRLRAKQLQASIAEMENEDQILPARIHEALEAADDFISAVRPHFWKLNMLTILVALHLVPTSSVLPVWAKGNVNILRLYEHTKNKAIAYLSVYHPTEELLSGM